MESAHSLDLELPVSVTVRNKFLFFVSHLVYNSLLQQLEQTEGLTIDLLSFSKYSKPLCPAHAVPWLEMLSLLGSHSL